MTSKDLLVGCVDPHLHVYPSLMKRYCDLEEMARLAQAAGYKAIVHKDHHYSSGALAATIKRHSFAASELQIFGSIALNNSVGALSPIVVEAAINFGARIVWLPTASAKNHIEFMKREKVGFPKLANGKSLEETPIEMLDGGGALKPEVLEVLRKIAEYPGVAIGAGHGSPREIDAVVTACLDLGIVDRLFIDHPTEIVEASREQIKSWAEKGATIELIAAQSRPPDCSLPIGDLVEIIEMVTPSRVMLASDMGMVKFGDPVGGYGDFLLDIFHAGISEPDLRLMSSGNASRLLGLA